MNSPKRGIVTLIAFILPLILAWIGGYNYNTREVELVFILSVSIIWSVFVWDLSGVD